MPNQSRLDAAVEAMADEQGSRWPSRRAAWLDGYRHGGMQARVTGEAGQDLRDLLSAIKVWQNATESRCRLLSNRESSDSMLAPDRALIEATREIEERLR